MKAPAAPCTWKNSGSAPKLVHLGSSDDGRTWQGKIFGPSIPSNHPPSTSGGSRSSAKVPEMVPAGVVIALHVLQVCYFLGPKPAGLGLLLATSGHGQLLTNTLLQQVQITLDLKTGIIGRFFSSAHKLIMINDGQTFALSYFKKEDTKDEVFGFSSRFGGHKVLAIQLCTPSLHVAATEYSSTPSHCQDACAAPSV